MHLYSAATGTDIVATEISTRRWGKDTWEDSKGAFYHTSCRFIHNGSFRDSSNKLNNTISKKFPFLSPKRANVLPVQIDQYTTLPALSAFSVLKEGWSLKHPSFFMDGFSIASVQRVALFLLVGSPVTPVGPHLGSNAKKHSGIHHGFRLIHLRKGTQGPESAGWWWTKQKNQKNPKDRNALCHHFNRMFLFFKSFWGLL